MIRTDLLKDFFPLITITLVGLVGIFLWSGWSAMFLAVLLIVLEVTLSFDNAVVNAQVLKHMSPVWQHRFFTWGIFIAVVLTRIILPIVIVAASTALSPWFVAHVAWADPVHYRELLEGAHLTIAAFGGMFLFMVGMAYFFDDQKKRHWLQIIEEQLAGWGRIESIAIGIALSLLLGLTFLLEEVERGPFLFAGVFGVALFILVRGIASLFSVESAKASAHAGLALFVYLEVLDAAFSLDSVIGAFALTSSLPIIIVGLGIGAYAVRFLTVLMVRRETLGHFVYLEHGAHWAILGLAAAMLGNIFFHVPEPFTGLVGITFVSFAYWSSVRLEKKSESA
ncbi:DUF475 domain-containing protein [Candidatus Kaiserbacteria bacterium]|nr:DUF475 domain-containing protein [Candidatus Kaiserbacteria bacterium]